MDTQENNLMEVLGIGDLSPEEQQDFMGAIGQVAIENALAKLIEQLSEEQLTSFEHYLEIEPEPDALLQHLSKHHDQFDELLASEVQSMKKEGEALFVSSQK